MYQCTYQRTHLPCQGHPSSQDRICYQQCECDSKPTAHNPIDVEIKTITPMPISRRDRLQPLRVASIRITNKEVGVNSIGITLWRNCTYRWCGASPPLLTWRNSLSLVLQLNSRPYRWRGASLPPPMVWRNNPHRRGRVSPVTTV